MTIKRKFCIAFDTFAGGRIPNFCYVRIVTFDVFGALNKQEERKFYQLKFLVCENFLINNIGVVWRCCCIFIENLTADVKEFLFGKITEIEWGSRTINQIGESTKYANY